MKKKYLAVVLGMALSFTSVSVFAEEETDSQDDVVIVEDIDEVVEYTGRIELVDEDGSLVISLGEWEDDDADETSGTLSLTGEQTIAAFADDVSAVSLLEDKTITVIEADFSESDEEDAETASEDSADADAVEEDAETSDSDTADTDVTEAEDTAEDETASEEADSEETETEELDVSTLQAGDIITYTLNEDGAIDTITLIGTVAEESDEALDEEGTSDDADAEDAEAEDAEDAEEADSEA
ncbi:MAG: DNA polymerase V family protein [Lachnospiraceae bacterium]|nr:DNA polymerase V family protein [Lachnospiraceae bacterium]